MCPADPLPSIFIDSSQDPVTEGQRSLGNLTGVNNQPPIFLGILHLKLPCGPFNPTGITNLTAGLSIKWSFLQNDELLSLNYLHRFTRLLFQNPLLCNLIFHPFHHFGDFFKFEIHPND